MFPPNIYITRKLLTLLAQLLDYPVIEPLRPVKFVRINNPIERVYKIAVIIFNIYMACVRGCLRYFGSMIDCMNGWVGAIMVVMIGFGLNELMSHFPA